MSILVVGSIAYDSIQTPFGKAEEVLGGSAAYFSASASLFAELNVVAVVGDDFKDEGISFLDGRKVDLSGLKRANGSTFRWKGSYGYDLNNAKTLETHLNVYEDFTPEIPEKYRSSEYVFLANTDPELQLHVLDQVDSPKCVACDTMNFWIASKPKELKKVISRVNIVTINETEAREFSGEPNLIKAAQEIMLLGPQILIVKRGEYGALVFQKERGIFSAPAYPLEDIFDPTGAGDSFAGGFMGYLANQKGDITDMDMKKAVIYGSAMASFNVEKFSLDRLKDLTLTEIQSRYKAFKELTQF